ncbi:MAG: hypothetical protein NC336_01950 [Clostridium sp.]|nr:hypothetical protein [Clostridium sp.]
MAGGDRLNRMIRRACDAVVDAVYPRCCEICGCRLTRSEEVLCLGCELEIPLTGLHRDPFNTIHQRIASHPPVEGAGAMFYYIRHDPYARLIHNAKYRGRTGIFRWLGRQYGRQLAADGFLDSVEAIQPVPMHWLKRLLRGYNQTESLADGLSDATGLPVVDCLEVTRYHATQTRKNMFERWVNARRTYRAVNVGELRGRHILLVDDVITTGSTIIACAQALTAADPAVRLSVASLGVTRML